MLFRTKQGSLYPCKRQKTSNVAEIFGLLMGCAKLFGLSNSFDSHRRIQPKRRIGYFPTQNVEDFKFELGSVDERIERLERVGDYPRPKGYPRYISTIRRISNRHG
jgi:hypothetical protein